MTGPRNIRLVRPDELEMLQEIERSAGRCFADIGMPEIADDAPLPLDELDRCRRSGLAWVAVGTTDSPVAYLVADFVDGWLHIEQVSVHAGSARRGIGRALVERAATHASAAGSPGLTLTTFQDVPWNAPYYHRCGFRVLDERDWTPGLRAIREREAAQGLDRWPRVCMRRDSTHLEVGVQGAAMPETRPARLVAISLDCPDPQRLADFYRELLGGRLLWSKESSVGIEVPGAVLVAQRVDDHLPPVWPGTSIVHLDLTADDLATAAERAVALGATVPEQRDPRWRVLLDPAGHPFCLTPFLPHSVG